MLKEIKEKFPNWCESEEKYNLCLSDDLDSFFSCIVLNKIKGYKIKYFYDFEDIYKIENYINQRKHSLVGVDIDLIKGKCWGNHVTCLSPDDLLRNKQSSNLNNILKINPNNYYKKYAGSTLLQIISYYNIDISNLTEESKMVLLCVDSTFLMYRNPSFRWIAKKWIVDILKLNDLYDVLSRHTQQEFQELNYKYNLKSKIWLDDNRKLNTNIKLDKLGNLFPNLSFNLLEDNWKWVHSFNYNTKYNTSFDKDDIKNLFSLAITKKNKVKYSTK